MSRIATIQIAYESLLGNARSEWDQFKRYVESTPLKIPVSFDQAGGGLPGNAGTMGGNAVPGGLPIGASSPNWSYLFRQQGGQLPIGASSPNYGYYFALQTQQLTAQMQAMMPTSSPNWSYLLGLGAGGGGGTPRPTPAQQNPSIRRVAFAGLFAYHEVDQAVRSYQENQLTGEMLGRGEIDQAIDRDISEGERYRSGLGGVIRKGLSGFGFPGSSLWDDEAWLEELRGAKAVRGAQKSSDSQIARNADIRGQTGLIGLGGYDKSIAESKEEVRKATAELGPLKAEIAKLISLGQGGTAGVLQGTVRQAEAAIAAREVAQNIEAARVRGLELSAIGNRTGQLYLQAQGDFRAADVRKITDEYNQRINAQLDPQIKRSLTEERDAALAANRRDVQRGDRASDLHESDSLRVQELMSRGQSRAAAKSDLIDRYFERFQDAPNAERRKVVLAQQRRAEAAFDANRDRTDFYERRAGELENQALENAISANPLGAIHANAAAQRAAIGALDDRDPKKATGLRQIQLREQLDVQRFNYQTNDIARGLGGEGRSLDLLLAHNPIGAEVNDIVTAADQESVTLQRSGRADLARQRLQNATRQINLSQQRFTEGFHAVEIGQNFETRNPRGEQDLNEAFKAFDTGRRQVHDAIDQFPESKATGNGSTDDPIVRKLTELESAIVSAISRLTPI